jgi:hypothetical protein
MQIFHLTLFKLRSSIQNQLDFSWNILLKIKCKQNFKKMILINYSFKIW